MRFNWLILIIMPFLTLAQVHKHVLPNGLEVWTKEDKRSPLVHVQVWYDVGAKDEPRGLTGISHVLEHMMFKGTKRFPGNAYRAQMASIGADLNAYTNQDETVYHITAHKSNLPFILELEADRMRNLLFIEDDFKKEMQVVLEERRRSYVDSPYGFVWDVVLRQAFVGSPYASPIIGYIEDLNNLQSSEAVDWYNKFYHPNNARVVVVGDIKHQEIIRLVEQYFGQYPKHDLPNRHTMQPPAYKLKRVVEFESSLQTPNLFMVISAPSHNQSPERAAALRLLRSVLTGAPHSPLSQSLVKDKRKANDVGSIYLPWWQHDSAFIINAEPAEGVTLSQLKDEIQHELKAIKNNITPQMIKDAEQGLKLSNAIKEDSMEAEANKIGIAAKLGVPLKKVETYRSVFPKDIALVQHELAQLLDERNLLTIYAYPNDRG